MNFTKRWSIFFHSVPPSKDDLSGTWPLLPQFCNKVGWISDWCFRGSVVECFRLYAEVGYGHRWRKTKWCWKKVMERRTLVTTDHALALSLHWLTGLPRELQTLLWERWQSKQWGSWRTWRRLYFRHGGVQHMHCSLCEKAHVELCSGGNESKCLHLMKSLLATTQSENALAETFGVRWRPPSCEEATQQQILYDVNLGSSSSSGGEDAHLSTTTCLYSWLVVHVGWQKEFFQDYFWHVVLTLHHPFSMGGRILG